MGTQCTMGTVVYGRLQMIRNEHTKYYMQFNDNNGVCSVHCAFDDNHKILSSSLASVQYGTTHV